METNSYKIKMPKPRNPLVDEAHFRKAGSHEKSSKAKRTKEKTDLRKEWL